MNNRLLGIVALIGSPMLLIEAVMYRFEQHDMTQLAAAMSLLYVVGWVCSVVGMYRLRATGSGLLGRAILVVQLVLLTLAAMWTLLYIPSPTPDTNSLIFQVTDLAWPLSHVFMLIVGIAVLRARVLAGLQRFAPLVCGLALPGSIVLSIIGGELAGSVWFAIMTALGFALLGYTIFAADSRTAPTYAFGTK